MVVPTLLQSLHARLECERDRLYFCIESLNALLNDVEQFRAAKVYEYEERRLRCLSLVSQLPPPLDFFVIDWNSPRRLLSMMPRTQLRRIRRGIRFSSVRLQWLYERRFRYRLDPPLSTSDILPLLRTLSYYHTALGLTLTILEGRRSVMAGGLCRAGDIVLQLREALPALLSLSSEIVEQFDEALYLHENPDVQNAVNSGLFLSGSEHFARQGLGEARAGGRSTGGVDQALLIDAHKLHETSRGRDTLHVSETQNTACIRYFANPGPSFEPCVSMDCRTRIPLAKVVAFYLPQFHTFEENDRWWGDGFTEWRNVARGTPRFAGHYQPRIPRDLGYYDLSNPSVLETQSKLALANGISAFCFYYYWFDGKRLMDGPLDTFARLNTAQEFCLMWANENWTRTWDGLDDEILIEQTYRAVDEEHFLTDVACYLTHERYLRIDGRPLFILYRPALLPSPRDTLSRWRQRWTELTGVEPLLFMAQGFGDTDPEPYGLDGAVEFPPHKLCEKLPERKRELRLFDPDFAGHVRLYTDVIRRSIEEIPPPFALFKTVVPHWDNDARREGRGLTLHGSTPRLYERWLQEAIRFARRNPVSNESVVFINAWNEWAEGAYLEPDVHYGHAYLNATRRAVFDLGDVRKRMRVLLVGHDAHRHGAQMLLLAIARTLTRQFGIETTVLLRRSGPLLREYCSTTRTVELSNIGWENLEPWLLQESFDYAICNTSVTGELVPVLKAAYIRVVSLVHEMPELIRNFQLQNSVTHIARQADVVLFPASEVEAGFRELTPTINAATIIRPQGLYRPLVFDATARVRIRKQLGIADAHKVVMNAGYADYRKGFDLFVESARAMFKLRDDIHFLWVGGLSPDMLRWFESLPYRDELSKRMHHVDFTDHMAEYYSASDAFYLTSREDPYPSVVLEAMGMGIPAVIYSESTGLNELVSAHGYLCDQQDEYSIRNALINAIFADPDQRRLARSSHVLDSYRFDTYCFDLLTLLRPDIKKVSVIVPNYNYASYLPERLHSIFNQRHPVFEIIVLDDASTDDSLQTIKDVAEKARREVQLLPNSRNSGSVFTQWARGAAHSRGDMLWIAEADDSADPMFLSESVASLTDSVALSFCNSRQIDGHGNLLAENYDYYYESVAPNLFKSDFNLAGNEFISSALAVKNVILNVSAVLWSAEVLREVLARTENELEQHALVGDWLLYLEALKPVNRRVAYLSKSLNVHRRHKNSVTQALDTKQHFEEIQYIHEHICARLQASAEIQSRMLVYRQQLREQFGLPPAMDQAAA